jgi:hypothetical protein
LATIIYKDCILLKYYIIYKDCIDDRYVVFPNQNILRQEKAAETTIYKGEIKREKPKADGEQEGMPQRISSN